MAKAFNDMTVTLGHWHQEAERRAQQVEDEYERFRSVTDSTTDAIVSANPQNEIVFWNLRASLMFGYEAHEAMGQPFTMLLSDRSRVDYAGELAHLPTGESHWLGSTVELTARRRDGTELPVELSLSTWKAGQQIFYTGVLRDVTERKQAAEVLRQREDQLRQAQKMEAVGRLAGGIAHDFNNMLTAILGYTELLLGTLAEGTRTHDDVVEIQKAGRSAAALTRELLAFGRKQVLQPVVLDLNTVVERDRTALAPPDRRRRRAASWTSSGRSAASMADRGQIEQVLVNLAVNARDAMPAGGRLVIRTATVMPARHSDRARHGLDRRAPGRASRFVTAGTACPKIRARASSSRSSRPSPSGKGPDSAWPRCTAS